MTFEALLRHGMISAKDLELFRYVESPAEAIAALKDRLAGELVRGTPAFAQTSTPGRGPEEAREGSRPDGDCHAPSDRIDADTIPDRVTR